MTAVCQIYYCCACQTAYSIKGKAGMTRHLPVGCKENSQRTVDVPKMKSRDRIHFTLAHLVHYIKNCFVQRMYFPSCLKTYCSYGLSTGLQYPLHSNPSFIQQNKILKGKECMKYSTWNYWNEMQTTESTMAQKFTACKLTIFNREHECHNYIYQAENRGNSQPKSES